MIPRTVKDYLNESNSKEKLNEGADEGSMSSWINSVNRMIDDASSAVNGKNGGNDPALSNAKDFITKFKQLSKVLKEISKLKNVKLDNLWFRDLI